MAKSIRFELKTSNDLVVFNGNVVTVGSLIGEKQKTEPNIQVCYHKLDMKADPPGAFNLTMVPTFFVL